MRVIPRSPAKILVDAPAAAIIYTFGQAIEWEKRASAISSESGGRASVSGVQTNTAT